MQTSGSAAIKKADPVVKSALSGKMDKAEELYGQCRRQILYWHVATDDGGN